MKTVIWVLLLAALAWKFSPEIEYWIGDKFSPLHGGANVVAANPIRDVSRASPSTASVPFQCDGRKYCSQMTSCAEAKQFLQSCPGMQMDGDNDGIPCESQWCH